MITLVDAVKHASIDEKFFSPATSCLGTRNYLQLDLKNGGWSVVRLNLIQRIFRSLFGWYENTRLEHVLVSARCEAKRRSYTEEQLQIVNKLNSSLEEKWWSHYQYKPNFFWRLMYYPEYARAFNEASKELQFAASVR